jgi:hypothetical protein
LRFSLAQARKRGTKGQRPSHQGFEIPRRLSPCRSLGSSSSHVCCGRACRPYPWARSRIPRDRAAPA